MLADSYDTSSRGSRHEQQTTLRHALPRHSPPRIASLRIAPRRNVSIRRLIVRIAICHLQSISPYSQSRAHQTERLNRETADEFERRTWRERCHYDRDGHILIPPVGFKQALEKAAAMLGRKIPGRGKATYTKFFLSGVMCIDEVRLPNKKDDVRGQPFHCHANGKRGSGTRVWRWFPMIDAWKAPVSIHVIADEITPDVFEETLQQAGTFVGIGRFRPENGGTNGRWTVEKVEWRDA
jgi:hypothetical protein